MHRRTCPLGPACELTISGQDLSAPGLPQELLVALQTSAESDLDHARSLNGNGVMDLWIGA